MFNLCFEYDNYGGDYHCWLQMDTSLIYGQVIAIACIVFWMFYFKCPHFVLLFATLLWYFSWRTDSMATLVITFVLFLCHLKNHFLEKKNKTTKFGYFLQRIGTELAKSKPHLKKQQEDAMNNCSTLSCTVCTYCFYDDNFLSHYRGGWWRSHLQKGVYICFNFRKNVPNNLKLRYQNILVVLKN